MVEAYDRTARRPVAVRIAHPQVAANSDARVEEIAAQVVGRRRELTLVLAAVAAGRDIMLEGPPGTSKSTMLRAITGRIRPLPTTPRRPGPKYASNWSHAYRIGVWQ